MRRGLGGVASAHWVSKIYLRRGSPDVTVSEVGRAPENKRENRLLLDFDDVSPDRLLRLVALRRQPSGRAGAIERGLADMRWAYGPTRVNCRSSVRCRAEKLSSEISVSTMSPAGVW